MNLQLRPKQEEVLNELRRNWKDHDTHLVYANVGFGKTAIAAKITQGFIERGLRVCFVAPYVTLVDQTAKRFMEYGLPQPSIIWQDHPWHDLKNLIQIASADTLIRRQMPDIDLLIIDECHIKRKRLLEIMQESDFKVIGLSGTPFANWMGKHYTNLVKVTTMKEMIEHGFLSDYDIFAPTKPNLKGVKTSNLASFGQDYVESQLAEIMGDAKIVGDIIKTWLVKGENEPTIAFCVNVAHANHITNKFNNAGVKAEVMTADTPTEERQLIIKRFEQGLTKIICNVGVLVAGFDSDVRCIIYARPTKSEIRWIQCLGRGLRTAKGKDRCIILDHSGTVHRLGLPCSIEYTELIDKDAPDAQRRQESRKKEKGDGMPKECGKCFYMKPPGVYVCPKCGHKPLYGEDVEVDESRDLSSFKETKKKVYTKQEKQDFWSELQGYNKERSLKSGRMYSSGWLKHKYKEKFGVWPQGLHDTVKPPSAETRNFIKAGQIRYAKRQEKLAGTKQL